MKREVTSPRMQVEALSQLAGRCHPSFRHKLFDAAQAALAKGIIRLYVCEDNSYEWAMNKAGRIFLHRAMSGLGGGHERSLGGK